MPTYDYRCEKCGNTFEVFQSMTAPKLTTCPSCKGKLKRLMGRGAGIIFKGSGFYATDYRSPSYKEAAKRESGGVKAAAEPKKASSSEQKSSSGKP